MQNKVNIYFQFITLHASLMHVRNVYTMVGKGLKPASKSGHFHRGTSEVPFTLTAIEERISEPNPL